VGRTRGQAKVPGQGHGTLALNETKRNDQDIEYPYLSKRLDHTCSDNMFILSILQCLPVWCTVFILPVVGSDWNSYWVARELGATALVRSTAGRLSRAFLTPTGTPCILHGVKLGQVQSKFVTRDGGHVSTTLLSLERSTDEYSICRRMTVSLGFALNMTASAGSAGNSQYEIDTERCGGMW
jgi:hypothetical protein